MRSIVAWCLRNRSVVLVVAGLLLAGGVFGATQLRQQFFPDADLPFLVTTVEAPGLDAAQVDDEIAVPLEQAASGVGDVEETQTISNQGRLTMITELAYGTDTDVAEEDLQAAFDELSLPPGAANPSIEGGFTDQAILIVALSTEDGLTELTDQAEDLQEELEDIEGVDRVEVEGGSERQVDVTLERSAIRSGLTPATLAESLGQAVQAQPVGLRETEGSSTPLRVAESDLDDADRLREFEVGDGRELGDVARIREATDRSSGFARTNGEPSVSLSVFKDEDADEVRVIQEAQQVLAAEGSEEGGGEATTIFQTASEVQASIRGLLLEGSLGALFAVLVVFMFLRSPRPTLVVGVAIPTSIVFGLLAAWLLGLTMNIITLAGLTIAVGRVIDDAIVVLENIYKHIERGETSARAAIDGTAEVATAVASSTLATVAVFLPLGLVGGLVSEIFLSFSIIVAVALLASLLVAVTLVPVLAVLMLRPRVGQADGGERLGGLIARITRVGLRHRLATIGVAIALFAGTIAVVGAGALPIQFLPESGTQQLAGQAELPPGTSTERAERLLEPLERELAAIPGIVDSQVSFGEAGLTFEPDDTQQGGSIFASFEEGADIDGAVERLREFGIAEYPEGFSVQQIENGPPTGQFDAVIRGESAAEVDAAAAKVTDLVEGRDDVVEVENQADRDQEQLVLELDPDEVGTPEADAARAALGSLVPTADVQTGDDEERIAVDVLPGLIDEPESLEDLPLPAEASAAPQAGGDQAAAGAAAGAAGGQAGAPPAAAGTSQGAGAEPSAGGVPQGAGAAPPPSGGSDPATTGAAGAAAAGAPTGAAPALPGTQPPTSAAQTSEQRKTIGDVGEVKLERSSAVRTRVDGDQAATVTARILGEDTNAVNAEIERELAGVDLGGATVELAGEQEFINQMFSDLGLAMIAAIALVYVVLLVFFGSAGQPLTILAPILFSTIGSLLALVITGQALGLPAMIGQLLLIGIVVANSILLVDTALRLRRRGIARDDALVQAARRRARPVFMTAVATIAALLPLAAGLSGEGGIISQSLGSVVVGGLLTATLLTLVIVPAVFTVFDRGGRRGGPTTDGAEAAIDDRSAVTDAGDGAAAARRAPTA